MSRVQMLAALAVIALAAVGWHGWRVATTPTLAEIPLENADPEVVRLIRAIEDEVRRQPRSGAAWGKLALALAANEFHQPALDCLAHAVRWDPHAATWPYLLGHLLATSQPAEAILWWTKALPLTDAEEQRAIIRFRLALLRIERREFQEAAEHLRDLAAIDPDGAMLAWAKGLLLVGQDNINEARAWIGKVVESPFARQQGLRLLAALHADHPDQSRIHQIAAAQAPKDSPWPDPFLAEMQEYVVNHSVAVSTIFRLGRQGKIDEARRVFARITAESPNLAASDVFGQALFDNHHFEEAAQVFQAALQLQPRLVSANYFFAADWLRKAEEEARRPDGKPRAAAFLERALTYVDKVQEVQADHAKAQVLRGRVLRLLGRPDEAVSALRQALVLRPDGAAVHLELGEALGEAGYVAEALTHLEKAVRLAPTDHPLPREALSRWRVRAGKQP